MVVICSLDLDIPNLKKSGIRLGEGTFHYLITLKSSSMTFIHYSFVDASDLESAIRNQGKYIRS